MNFRYLKGTYRSECGNFEIKRWVNTNSVNHIYASCFHGKMFALSSYVTEAKRACREHKVAA
jgi:hypothetical protein